MKPFTILIVCLLALAGCTPNAQVITLRGNNVTPTDKGLVFDNDTLTLSYSFFSERGLMKLTVYNKLSVPLFINWKNSAFIVGSDKFDYWQDVADVELRSRLYRSPYFTSYGLSGTISKGDQIGFIPPQTKLVKQQFVILPSGHLRLSGQPVQIQEKSYSGLRPGKKTVMMPAYSYTSDNSPCRFRNFLTISTQRDFQKEFYIDTRFYAADIRVMRATQLGYKPAYYHDASDYIYNRPKSPDSFYLFTKSSGKPVSAQ